MNEQEARLNNAIEALKLILVKDNTLFGQISIEIVMHCMDILIAAKTKLSQ